MGYPGSMLRWAVVLGTWWAARGLSCPERCRCVSGADLLLECDTVHHKTFTVNIQPNDYVKFNCMRGSEDVGCEEFPSLSNTSLAVKSARVKRCSLAGGARCVLARAGAAAAATLVLESAGPFTVDQLQGLAALETLYLFYADRQRTVPLAGLGAPRLRHFRLSGARVALAPRMFEGAPPALAYLELSSDGIRAVPPGTFRGMANLTELNMFGNRIDELAPGALDGLDSLEMLCLNSNNLTGIGPGVFSSVPRLKRVKLRWVYLEELSAEVFTGHPSVEEIQIQNLVPLVLRERALAAMAALRNLDLSSSGIRHLPANLWEQSRSLVNITLRDNEIVALPGDLFRHQAALEKLDLSHNRIAAIDSTTFRSLTSLVDLNLDHNSLEALPEYMLSGLNKLDSLSINGNSLLHIAYDAFNGLPALTTLSLSKNRLTFGPTSGGSYSWLQGDSPLHPLARLRRLDLSHNNISVVRGDWTNVLALTLQHLDLSHNTFTALLFDVELMFLGPVRVDLTHNRISTVRFNIGSYGAAFLTDDGVSARSAPTVLLGGNPFDCDCTLYHVIRLYRDDVYVRERVRWNFTGAECARPTSLAGVGLLNVSADRFTCDVLGKECPESCSCTIRAATSELEMTCDSLPEVPPPRSDGVESVNLTLTRPSGSLRSLPSSVTKLSLKGLGLEEVPEVPVGLRVLDLSDNDLSEIPVGLIRTTNATLRLEGNRFACDCFNSEDVDFFNRNSDRIQDYERIDCGGGGAIANVNAERLCSAVRGALVGGVLAVVGILAAVAITVLHRYRLAIKIFLYNRGWFGIREDELDEGKRFDVFVSFAHRDEKFVVDELLPKLENCPDPFEVCVHHRDWIVGDWIPAQIVRSVESSRRTLVVLSENFLNSVWGQLEFRAAHLQATKDGRARVIIVVLDDVLGDPRIDSELKTYLSTNTYVKWGDPWFWDKLRYALPHKRKIKDRSERKAIEEKAADDRAVELLKNIEQKGGLDVQLSPEGKLVNAALKV